MREIEHPNKSSAKEKILIAAAEIFSSQGIKGATTREIAKQAGVNETTLFRNFETKDALLRAVVEQKCLALAHRLSLPELWTGELEADLKRFAVGYENHLRENEALVRMFIGESHREPEKAQRVIQAATKPLRQRLLDYLMPFQKEGRISKSIGLEQAIDAFTGMILAGVLRRGLMETQYSHPDYLETCVHLFVHGLLSQHVKDSE